MAKETTASGILKVAQAPPSGGERGAWGLAPGMAEQILEAIDASSTGWIYVDIDDIGEVFPRTTPEVWRNLERLGSAQRTPANRVGISIKLSKKEDRVYFTRVRRRE